MPQKQVKNFISVLFALMFAALFLFGCAPVTPDTDDEDDEPTLAEGGTGYRITFDTRVDGLKVSSIHAEADEPITAPSVPYRKDYDFDGWFLENDRFVFTVMPAADLTLTARWIYTNSKFPALRVSLHNDDGTGTIALGAVSREKYVSATIGIGSADVVGEAAGFKGRGNGSWGGNKKPYRIKFDKKQSFFGWPKSKHYTLISSTHNFADGSMLVADTAFSLTRSVLTNLEYAPRTRAVDLYVNNAYQGVYILADKIRVEEDRVDIISEHNVDDTGYLLLYANESHGNDDPGFARFSVDGDFRRAPQGSNQSGAGANGFRVKSPDADDVADPALPEVTRAGYDQQVRYIKSKTQGLTDAMKSKNFAQFSQLAEVNSFVDGYIIQELYKNDDVGEGGYYLYKKSTAEGGKFYAGPPWDFDRSCGGEADDRLGIANGQHQANPFITYLCVMPEFKALVKARWAEISADVKDFLQDTFNGYINDTEYQNSYGRNRVKWNNAGQEQAARDWVNSATGKRDWLVKRANFLDTAYAAW